MPELAGRARHGARGRARCTGGRTKVPDARPPHEKLRYSTSIKRYLHLNRPSCAFYAHNFHEEQMMCIDVDALRPATSSRSDIHTQHPQAVEARGDLSRAHEAPMLPLRLTPLPEGPQSVLSGCSGRVRRRAVGTRGYRLALPVPPTGLGARERSPERLGVGQDARKILPPFKGSRGGKGLRWYIAALFMKENSTSIFL